MLHEQEEDTVLPVMGQQVLKRISIGAGKSQNWAACRQEASKL